MPITITSTSTSTSTKNPGLAFVLVLVLVIVIVTLAGEFGLTPWARDYSLTERWRGKCLSNLDFRSNPMAVAIQGKYLGNKRVELTHGPTGMTILTDAPKDNQGEGRTFSPTDLVAGALGACMLTILAIVGERSGMKLDAMQFELEKHMNENPRRIGELPVSLHLPAALTPPEREKLERAATLCPVFQSLHPAIEFDFRFLYDV